LLVAQRAVDGRLPRRFCGAWHGRGTAQGDRRLPLEAVTTFVNPKASELGAGYQIIHSTIALGTGGLTGVGFGESREKRGAAFRAAHDFIFAIVGEEFGLIGTGRVLLLFLLLAAWLSHRSAHA
jgi:cell division protein FtsW (lipid II flippase)